ncbi:polysaccharide biosynthesis/export family protein [Gluconacetobacter azotocaptans]|uniref:polysaccharide biosynthesis/export family protein n=1 Tax=Gluconacetobacter azotocaptans TaxID=142834 RepID=UPI00222E0FFE|nr:polysaccharide biosynthesis/export family protein [Gluconacetobacter azotocaptans]
MAGVLSLAGCSALPGTGPIEADVLSSQDKPGHNPLGFRIVPLTPATVSVLESEQLPSLSTLDATAPALGANGTIGPGDELSISVFEVGSGLFASGNSAAGARTRSSSAPDTPASNVTMLPPIGVDQHGDIPFPYIGNLHAAGMTESELGKAIASHLAGLAQDPQVLVHILTDLHNSVIVSGDIHHPGRQFLTLAHEGLLDIVAMAGGATHSTEDSIVLLSRKGVTGRVPLRTLENDPTQNIPLMPGDQVQVIYLPRTYTVFGAAHVTETPFNTPVLTLAQAAARIGGPDDARADPNAVFLFRFESNPVAGKLGLSPRPGGVPIIYKLDMMEPTAYFLAGKVAMKDKDLIYVANAKTDRLYKLVNLIGTLVSPAMSAAWVAK